MIKKKIFLFIFVFFYCCNGQTLFSPNVKYIDPKNELNCDKMPIYKNLEITTNIDENSDDYNIVIMKNCQIKENWRVKEDNTKQCVVPQRVFEGEDNIRRSFRFSYKQNTHDKDKIVVRSIKLDYPKNIAETSLTKSEMTLYPGESVDIYVDYDCLDMDKNKKVSADWFKLRVDIEFENKKIKSFEYYKICTATYSEKLDFSHILIIAVVFLIVFV
jgi:hypothetical protein